MEIPLKHIVATVDGSLRHGISHMVYGLDEDGKMWHYSPDTSTWKRLDNPRTGSGKDKPDEVEGEHRTWREL